MDETDRVVGLLTHRVEAGELPGWGLAAGQGNRVEILEAGGCTSADAGAAPITLGTLFDLASLTKVVATLPITLALVHEGAVTLETPVVTQLPEFGRAPERARVTVAHLLTHTSGLPATPAPGARRLPPDRIWERLLAEPLETAPGIRVNYSDVGFLILGRLLERVAGDRLDVLFERHVTSPLGLAHTRYGPVERATAAATERRADGRACQGTVHDELAAELEVPTGHAGLFSTAGDLAGYLIAWASPNGGWLPDALRALAMRDLTGDLDGHRGLGWTARHDSHDQLGPAWPASAVFHSGFTGTSLALDPHSRRWVVLLTNDVHLGRGRGVINPLRRAVHTALAPG